MKASIATLMAVIAVVALESASLRALLTGSMFQRIAAAPITIAIQVAVYAAIRRRDAARWFWCGFAASGTLTMLSLAWYPRHRGSFGHGLWTLYFRSVGEGLSRLPAGLADRIEGDWWTRAAVVGVYTAIPQLLASSIGGFVLYFVLRRSPYAGRRLVDRP